MQLLIPLSRGGRPLSKQVYSGFRDAILSGALRPGERLPSTREVAEQLRVSRTVVLSAFDQLLAEGFAVGRRGSGTYVSSEAMRPSPPSKKSAALRLSKFGGAADSAWTRMTAPWRKTPAQRFDFSYGRSDLESFPFEIWRRILLRHARKAPVSELDYGPAAGNPALREVIAAHLRRSRAVVCDASQVIVVNGSQQALDLIARVLVERGDGVALENPCYQGIREVLNAAGAKLCPVAVDRDGLNPAKLPADARIAFVTPSHQFPTGAVLPLARRMSLLSWAHRRNAVIVEDDYDGEFHYEGGPLESLQGLDPEGRVIYIGTFSRTVFSSLRIGYLVAPKNLVQALSAAKWLSDRHTATLEQETLAEFISEGFYERYLRRTRRRNAARRAALLDAVEKCLGDKVEVTGAAAGAHIVLWPRRGVSEAKIISAAAEQGVRVYGTAGYFLKKPIKPGILVGYSRIAERDIPEAVRRLAKAFEP